MTRFDTHHMRWASTYLTEHQPTAAEAEAEAEAELRRFVFGEAAVERALAPLDVPATCGSLTCGVDCAVVRASGVFNFTILVREC